MLYFFLAWFNHTKVDLLGVAVGLEGLGDAENGLDYQYGGGTDGSTGLLTSCHIVSSSLLICDEALQY